MGNKLKGGSSDKMSKLDIAKKFKVTIGKLNKELKMGVAVELEHVNNRTMASEIAMDHLVEIPDYYTRLKAMEKKTNIKWGVNETLTDYIKVVLHENIKFDVSDETPDVISYNIYYNDKKCGMMGLAPVNDMDSTMELVFIGLDNQYKSLTRKLIVDIVINIWSEFNNINRIILTPEINSRGFWHKVGATRLNNEYLMLLRGH